MSASVTVVYVAYGVSSLDLSWIPDDEKVIVVHNDDGLDDARCSHPGVVHIHSATNVGFGAGINRALAEVDTERVVLCNPDTSLSSDHFQVLASGDEQTIVAVPLVEADGTPNAVVNPYWSAGAFLATAWRLGRFLPRDGRLLSRVGPYLGGWGRGHTESLAHTRGTWSVRDRWGAGAVLSLPTSALHAVGGFDEEFFLYFEDADLHQRLAVAIPELTVSLADVVPARHLVGGCVSDERDARAVARHRRRSARTYASRQSGVSWRIAESLLAVGGS